MKWLIAVGVLVYGVRYAGAHYHLHDALAYAKAHPESRKAPAIDYYVGLVYYQRSEYQQAQEAFTQLLTDYPTAQYLPKALLRLEDSAENDKDWDTAKMAASTYVQNYPDQPDFQLMKSRLDMLNYQHP